MRNRTVVYEVNLHVDRDVAEEFRRWLPEHIAEILALGAFHEAVWWERVELDAPDRVHWCVHYRAENDERVERYLRDHAPRLRQDGQMRFGGRFDADRRVLRLCQRYVAKDARGSS